MVNYYRGEVSIITNSDSYILRLSFNDLANIEARTSMSFLSFVSSFSNKTLSIENIIILLEEASIDSGRKLSREKIEEIFSQHGLKYIIEKVTDLLHFSLLNTYGDNDAK